MPRLKPEHAAMRAADPAARDFSKALARGLQIITSFGPQTRAMTLSEVARAVDLPRATARRTLLTLARLGYAKEEAGCSRSHRRYCGWPRPTWARARQPRSSSPCARDSLKSAVIRSRSLHSTATTP